MDRTARPMLGVAVVARVWPLLVALASPATSQTRVPGDPVCVAPGSQHDPICSLNWITWTDERSGVPQAYGTPSRGVPSGVWPANGLNLAPGTTAQLDVAADASTVDGSLWVAWSEDRGEGTGDDIYLTRYLSDGLAPGWPASGLRICSAAGGQRRPRLLTSIRFFNGLKYVIHALVTWEDSRAGEPVLFGIDVEQGGSLASGWPVDGLSISTGVGAVSDARILPRDTSFTVVWQQGGSIVAQSVARNGVVPDRPGWPAQGRVLSDPAFTAAHMDAAYLGYSNADMVAWEEDRGDHTEIRAQGWIGSSTPDFQAITVVDEPLAHAHDPRIVEDRGDALVYWVDERQDAGDLYGARLIHSTQFPQHFTLQDPNGMAISAAPGVQGPLADGAQTLSPFWEDTRSGVPQIYCFYRQDEPTGSPLAPGSGSQTQAASTVITNPSIPEAPPDIHVSVAWTDTRNSDTAPDIYGQRFGLSGPEGVGVPPRLPARVVLSSARPIPSRRETRFDLELPDRAAVRLDVVDVAGRGVRTIVDASLDAGRHALAWDGLDAGGRRAPAGLYWLHGRAGSVSLSRRIVLIAP